MRHTCTRQNSVTSGRDRGACREGTVTEGYLETTGFFFISIPCCETFANNIGGRRVWWQGGALRVTIFKRATNLCDRN